MIHQEADFLKNLLGFWHLLYALCVILSLFLSLVFGADVGREADVNA